jgi:hypothetical protein
MKEFISAVYNEFGQAAVVVGEDKRDANKRFAAYFDRQGVAKEVAAELLKGTKELAITDKPKSIAGTKPAEPKEKKERKPKAPKTTEAPQAAAAV